MGAASLFEQELAARRNGVVNVCWRASLARLVSARACVAAVSLV